MSPVLDLGSDLAELSHALVGHSFGLTADVNRELQPLHLHYTPTLLTLPN